MSEKNEQQGEIFDLVRLKDLIKLMKDNDLSEMDLRESEQRIRIRRGGDQPTVYSAPPVTAPVQSAPAAVGPAASDENIDFIKSPMVGTFYAKPNPESEAYVKVGDVVSEETIVCQVEAMKMFNELPAGISGKIVAILVKNEDPVDVSKPLFKIDTSAS